MSEMTISLAPARTITHRQQRAMTMAALARNPASLPLKVALLNLHLWCSDFAAAVDVAQDICAAAPGAAAFRWLTMAHLALDTPENDRAALLAAQQAVALATGPSLHAQALAGLGKALGRLGDMAAAQEAFDAALASDPANQDAYKRRTALHFAADQPMAVLELADHLLAAGVSHSELLASRTRALALMHRMEAARESAGLAAFLYHAPLSAPDGWPSTAAFNAALADDLAQHPALQFDRAGAASAQTWRIDEPATGGSPLVAALQRAIVGVAEAYVARLSGEGHCWMTNRPLRGAMHDWCLITEAGGFEQWHIHQNGWLSGVYYVAVPDAISNGTDERGCLMFGLPDLQVGADAATAYGQQIVRPEQGLLLLFPSHCYHRTIAHGLPQRRIAYSFDIWPDVGGNADSATGVADPFA